MKYNKLLLIVVSTTAAASAFAATTGGITLQGTIAPATAITVTGTAPYNSLDLNTTQTNLLVANVREVNNTSTGYTVKLSSANNGLLANGAADSIAYTATYNDSAVSLTSTPVAVTQSAPQNVVVNTQKPFKISYTGVTDDSKMAGSYTDTLTFTISAP